MADKIFQVIQQSAAFDWKDGNNNCEDRANAVSIILDKWGISNGKAWTFAGYLFDKSPYRGERKEFEGTLGEKNSRYNYNYHVATTILVANKHQGHGAVIQYDTLIIDPLMDHSKLMSIAEWSNALTKEPTNVYIVTNNDKYQQNGIPPTSWKRSDDNYDETIMGLTRYNTYSVLQRIKTKHFLRKRYDKVKRAFENLQHNLPSSIKQVNCK